MTISSLLYFGALALWSAFITYLILERFFPLRKEGHASPLPEPAVVHSTPAYLPPERVRTAPTPSAPAPGFNPAEGFKSFQTGGELTVDDIVKGLSRG